MPHLVTLFAQIDLSVSLAVLEDDTVIYLETLYGPGHSSAVLRTDTRAPAHCTAAGKLLLAYDPELVNRYGREVPLIALTPNTITTRIAFAAELTRIRAEGIAYNREEYVPGLIGAACPIMSGNQRPVATISIMGLAGGTDIMTVSDKLRRSAHAASVALRRVARAGH
jgi:IclR family KDG regulon transcriptional repressor